MPVSTTQLTHVSCVCRAGFDQGGHHACPLAPHAHLPWRAVPGSAGVGRPATCIAAIRHPWANSSPLNENGRVLHKKFAMLDLYITPTGLFRSILLVYKQFGQVLPQPVFPDFDAPS